MSYKKDMNKGIRQVLTEQQHTPIVGELPKITPIVDGHPSKNPMLVTKEADADWARRDHKKPVKAWA